MNGDRRPDIWVVLVGGRERCRAVDLNFDGLVDAFTYVDGSGTLARREYDYDKDGQIDEIALYQAGAVQQKQRASARPAKIDTWEYFARGLLARTERDSNGDGIVDQWWEYPKPGCPMIHVDTNGDGRPDPGATIDYCTETGYVPPDRQDAQPRLSPNFERGTALPTETDNRPADAPGAVPAAASNGAPVPAAPAVPPSPAAGAPRTPSTGNVAPGKGK